MSLTVTTMINRSNLTKIFISVLLLVTIFSTWFGTQPEVSKDILFAWGIQDGRCVIYSLDPVNGTSEKHSIDEQGCNFWIQRINNVSHLVHLTPYPGKVTVYQLLPETLKVYQVIEFGEIELTSKPQWRDDSIVYISGIQSGREQIFKVDIQTNDLSEATNLLTGMAYDPLIAPDGSTLVYQYYDLASNRHEVNECFEGCQGVYHVLALDSGVSYDLSTLVETSQRDNLQNYLYAQCQGNWSPLTERLLIAVKIGCQTDTEMGLIIDLTQKEVVSIINPQLPTLPLIDIVEWFNNNELLYNSPSSVLINQPPIRRFYIYNISNNTTSEFGQLPALDASGSPFEVTDMDWANDGKGMVGVIYNTKSNEPEIIIASVDQQNMELIYTKLIGFQPMWSTNDKLIAYLSGKEIQILTI